MRHPHPSIDDMGKEVFALIPSIQDAVQAGIDRHVKSGNQNKIRMQNERKLMEYVFQFIQKKWVSEIMYSLVYQQQPHFNEIKKNLSGISSKTLSIRLKELEEIKVINRIVEGGTPIRVSYTVTELGLNLFKLLIPFMVFFAKNQLF